MKKETIFSPDRQYRYQLWREWIGGDGYVQIIGLNPSIADETDDDKTITRCINFAKSWGYSGLCMTNLFAFCATKPADMKAAEDPVGRDNDIHLMSVAKSAGVIIAAWGNDGSYRNRANQVMSVLPPMHILKLNGDGSPGHPLYLKKTLRPIPWEKK
jgi:hypothetical protein